MFGINSLFDAMLDYLYGELVKGLSDFFVLMNQMGVDVLELPWVAALVSFFAQLGWVLFLAGISVAILETAIEAQNGKAALRDTALNLIKGFLAVNLFTVVPVELFKFSVGLQGQLGRAMATVFQAESTESIGTLAMNLITPLTGFALFNLVFILMMSYAVIKVFFRISSEAGYL